MKFLTNCAGFVGDNSTLTISITNIDSWSPAILQAKDTTGKHYFEVNHISGFYLKVGLCNLSLSNYWYLDDYRGGAAQLPTATKATVPSYANNGRLMVAYDLDAGKVWFGVNGTWFASGNPVTNTNPTLSNITAFGVNNPVYPYIDMIAQSGSSESAQFFVAPADWLYVPSGFAAPTPFDMGGRLMNSTLRRDVEFGGGYRIAGTAQRLGVGCKKRVRLMDRKTGILIQEKWSASDGAFSFDWLANRPESYIVMELDDLSYDPWYDPACADRVTPEAMP